MQAASLSAPHASFLPPAGVCPLLPPFLLPRPPPRGSLFPHFPPRFPPLPPVIPGGPFFPPQQFIPRGPGGPNFSVTPQFSPGPHHWAPYPKRPPKNKHTRHHRKLPRENYHSGTNTGQPLFICNPCHKEYKSQQTYDVHLATHVKCSKCDFECSKGAMHDHELIHYLPPELTFMSKEDIAKWRQERKKNFPTAANVSQKKELQEKREKQGDVADTPLYRYVSRVCGGSQEFSRQRGGKRNHWVVGSNKRHSHRGRERGSEEGERGQVSWKRGRGGRRGRGGWRDRTNHAREGFEKSDGRGLRYVPAKKPTLLEKLLAREIRVEQNALLQCVRHIVSRNFFRPSSNKLLDKGVEEEGEGSEEREGKGEEDKERMSETAAASSEQTTEH